MSDWLSQFDLDTTIVFYHITHTNDGYGTVTKTRTSYATKQCAAWKVGANEALISEQRKNPYSMTVVLKPFSGVLATDEVKIDGVYYTIASPDNVMSKDDVLQLNIQPLTV